MRNQNNSCGVGTGFAFFAGAFIGAGTALFLAPQSGAETRTKLRDYAGRAKEEIWKRGREAKAAWENAIDQGRASFEAAQQHGREAFEAVEESVRDVGRRTV